MRNHRRAQLRRGGGCSRCRARRRGASSTPATPARQCCWSSRSFPIRDPCNGSSENTGLSEIMHVTDPANAASIFSQRDDFDFGRGPGLTSRLRTNGRALNQGQLKRQKKKEAYFYRNRLLNAEIPLSRSNLRWNYAKAQFPICRDGKNNSEMRDSFHVVSVSLSSDDTQHIAKIMVQQNMLAK